MEKDNRMVIDEDERLEFCSFEQSVELKKLGLILDSPFGYYDNGGELIIFGDEVFYDGTYAPLIQQAFRFFREKYNLIGFVEFDAPNNINRFHNDYTAWVLQSVEPFNQRWINVFETYEEAEQASLNRLIEIAKESKQ